MCLPFQRCGRQFEKVGLCLLGCAGVKHQRIIECRGVEQNPSGKMLRFNNKKSNVFDFDAAMTIKAVTSLVVKGRQPVTPN
jgi:hypothetical protein